MSPDPSKDDTAEAPDPDSDVTDTRESWPEWSGPGALPDDQALRQAIELLFFAYRDFTEGPDKVLDGYDFGRAHHRVIHFVGHHPGITVQELLSVLRITKQSLSRVLSALLKRGYVEQQSGKRDRRLRHLYLTEEGRELERECSNPQRALVRRAFDLAGPDAVDGYRTVLAALINETDRDRILDMIRKP